ncbi:MAG: pyridoxal-phosphate dependent enzyme [Armatimonadota bacterium]|nr:pyridoxal-phosphate dependent enzyme [Armatimonadota bacterium]
MNHVTGFRCLRCGNVYQAKTMPKGCPDCAARGKPSNVSVLYDYDALRRRFDPKALVWRAPTMWRYKELLPPDEEHVVTLGEGMTALLAVPRLGARLGLPSLYVKDESRNATWSFKDRMASAAVSVAKELGARVITASSSGNAGSATAAYAARAGLDCVLFTLQSFPTAMKVNMQVYGTKLIACPTLKDRWRMVEKCVDEYGWFPTAGFVYPLIGSNPYAIEGYKTIAYEVCEQFGWKVPDVMVLPVGAGDAFFGAWKGFNELRDAGIIDAVPRMMAAEVLGPLENAIRRGIDYVEEVPYRQSVGISAGTFTSTYQALKTVLDSGGTARSATDDEMLSMQKALAASEGIYVECSSALAVAVAARLVREGLIQEHETVVCLLTASGLKDPETTLRAMPEIPLIEPTLEDLERALAATYGFRVPAPVEG